MSVLVVCPTRDRPVKARELVDHFVGTTGPGSNSRMVFVVDDDQDHLYDSKTVIHPRVETFRGPRRSVVEMLNTEVMKRIDEYDAFGLMVDDAIFASNLWDQWVTDRVNEAPDKVQMVAPWHSYGPNIDMPYVSREWVKRVGWVANPEFKYWGWVTFNWMIGEMTTMVEATREQFSVEHVDMGPRYWESFDAESRVFHEQCMWNLRAAARRVRGLDAAPAVSS